MPRDVVLCVDDEPIVLRACTTAVALAGFRAVVAENGAAGFESFVNLKHEICMVLSDIIMPGLNGIELAERIVKIDPKMKVLLMSGYGDTVIDMQGPNPFPLIRKPFIHSVLIARIRALLADSDAAASAT